jgi:hypothetical protein
VTKFVRQASQPSAGRWVRRAHYRNRRQQSVGILRKTGGVKSPKKIIYCYLSRIHAAMAGVQGILFPTFNNKKLQKQCLFSNKYHTKISHSKNNLKNHAKKCKYGTASCKIITLITKIKPIKTNNIK